MPRDPEKARIRRERWKLAHPEKHKASQQKYVDTHREEILEKARLKHREAPEKRKAYYRLVRKAPPFRAGIQGRCCF